MKAYKRPELNIGKNPAYTQDELILLLDVYFQIDIHRASAISPEVI
jgi:hypothetical protein